MSAADDLMQLVSAIAREAHACAEVSTIDVEVIRRLCIYEAAKSSPALVDYLTSARGSAGVVIALSSMPHLFRALNESGSIWAVIRTIH